VTRSYTNQVELRRYTSSWSAPSVLASGIIGGDVGVLFDALSNRGMATWASGATLYKKDFNAFLVAPAADTLQTNALGLFAVGDTGNGATFPLIYFDAGHALARRVVQSDPP
jgi:hypothetical protein